MDDPIVAEDKIPAYDTVEEKIRQIDSTVIIARTFYVPDNLLYRFQLVKKNKMCMMEVPKKLLDDLKNNSATSEEDLKNLIQLYIQHPDAWVEIKE
jgi:hypothetical protein